MSDPIQLPAALAIALEQALNRYLRLDPAALERLAGLTGRVIAVELRGLGMTFYLAPHGSGLRVLQHHDQPPDAVLSGTPNAFLRLGSSAKPLQVLFAGDVEISGDVELGQQFKVILDDMEVDWEEQLSKVVGDVAAHHIGNLAHHSGAWLSHTADSLSQDMEEYLHEESRVLPQGFETDEFFAQVDTLREDVERLEQRIQRLQQNRESSA